MGNACVAPVTREIKFMRVIDDIILNNTGFSLSIKIRLACVAHFKNVDKRVGKDWPRGLSAIVSELTRRVVMHSEDYDALRVTFGEFKHVFDETIKNAA